MLQGRFRTHKSVISDDNFSGKFTSCKEIFKYASTVYKENSLSDKTLQSKRSID
jgi:hypothetical protein